MVSGKRLEDLRAFHAQAQDSLVEVTARRDKLLEWQAMGMRVEVSDQVGDQFPALISDADKAVIAYQKVCIYLGSLVDRALAGEDV